MPDRSLARAAAIVVAGTIAAGLLSACGTDTPDSAPGAASTMASHGESSPVAAGARHIDVAARSFAFDPAAIRIAAGEDIAIVLASSDSKHDFTVDDFGAHVAAKAGEQSIGGLRADTPGRYRYFCSVPGHRQAGMEGVLVVED